MAEQKKKEHDENVEVMELEPVKAIEIETKNLVASSRIFIYTIIGLLVYLIFFLLPNITEKMHWMEKDLHSVLVQSERFKTATQVFARDNQCASCHLSPDYLLHDLLSKYPSFADIKAFMQIGHQRYWTSTAPIPDEELLEIYRALK
jgi:hypothetical protein